MKLAIFIGHEIMKFQRNFLGAAPLFVVKNFQRRSVQQKICKKLTIFVDVFAIKKKFVFM